jgi:hypothetical protein
MGSVFVTQPDNDEMQIKGFLGKEYAVPFYLQFVPGYVIEVIHSPESPNYKDSSCINTIIALPHHTDKVYKSRAAAGEEYRYYPLIRGISDVPSKGDPVLLCTIGKIKYYLGPLNTNSNSPTWNDDHLYRPEQIIPNDNMGIIGNRDLMGESYNFNKEDYFGRMSKRRIEDLDYGENPIDTVGDTIIEGRHGNSIRVGSRSDDPYILISNKRHPDNFYETLGDGTIISITSQGSLAQHFIGYNDDTLQRTVYDFTLGSDTIPPDKIKRLMGTLIKSSSPDVDIYNYGFRTQTVEQPNVSQVLLHSDRITINTKTDDIFLSSIKDIHIGTGRKLNISTNEDLIISSERTFLGDPNVGGENGRFFKNLEGSSGAGESEMQPMVLGKELFLILDELLDVLSRSASNMYFPLPLAADGIEWKLIMPDIKEKLKRITSNYHFIEPNTRPVSAPGETTEET